jgi:predicted RNA-binding Zn ribbon-like protein
MSRPQEDLAPMTAPPSPIVRQPPALCLEFANTGSWRRDAPADRLARFQALARFCQKRGVIESGEAERLEEVAAARPETVERALEAAEQLREAVRAIFSALAAGHEPPPPALDGLNGALRSALAGLRLARTGRGLEWAWPAATDDETLERLVWPFACAAADLLTAGEVGRVRACADADCRWLFLDRSRNRSRRWCSMSDCGNRAKARRHYRRVQAARS